MRRLFRSGNKCLRAGYFVCLWFVAFLSLFLSLEDSPQTVVVTISSVGFPVDYSSPFNKHPPPPPFFPPNFVYKPETYLPHCKHRLVGAIFPLLQPVASKINERFYGSKAPPRKLADLSVASLATCTLAVSSSNPFLNVAEIMCGCVSEFRKNHDMTTVGLSKWKIHRAECRMVNIVLVGAGCASRPLCELPLVRGNPLHGDFSLRLQNPLKIGGRVPQDVSSYAPTEGITYHTLWRAVRHLYDHFTESSCKGPSRPFSLLPGWTTVLVIEALPEGSPVVNARPLGHVAVSGDTMLLAFRGTTQSFDWVANLQYSQVETSKTLKWDGRVHRGMTKFVEAVLPPVLELLRQPQHSNISRVIFSGHSLGAAIATLVGYQVAILTQKFVDVVGFASPKVGNAKFVKALSRTVNHRNIVFDLDLIEAIPCHHMPVCMPRHAIVPTTPNRFEEERSYWTYHESPGRVQFGVDDLPESSLWKTLGKAKWQLPPNHICAYTCWLSQKFSPGETFTECDYSPSVPNSLPNVCQFTALVKKIKL